MHLIADSGGTKTTWAWPSGTHSSPGINLSVLGEAEAQAILTAAIPQLPAHPAALHFYGAGLGDPARHAAMHTLLQGVFPGTAIHLATDLLGAARATCLRAPGHTAILGTGSIACHYDGNAITATHGGHGWALGDEGSGADLGKALLKAALDGHLSPTLSQALQDWAQADLITLRTRLYRAQRPNAYLGTFAPFLHAHRAHPQIHLLLQERFSAFAHSSLIPFRDSSPIQTLHTVGGIAHAFQDEIRQALIPFGWSIGTCLGSPIEGLAAFHGIA